VPFTAVATQPNYTLYGGDVSAFAGQISDLALTAGLFGTGWNLDSIEFSPQSVPEPSTWILLVSGVGLLSLCRQRRSFGLVSLVVVESFGSYKCNNFVSNSLAFE
jgi:PEP-CTERM motif